MGELTTTANLLLGLGLWLWLEATQRLRPWLQAAMTQANEVLLVLVFATTSTLWFMALLALSGPWPASLIAAVAFGALANVNAELLELKADGLRESGLSWARAPAMLPAMAGPAAGSAAGNQSRWQRFARWYNTHPARGALRGLAGAVLACPLLCVAASPMIALGFVGLYGSHLAFLLVWSRHIHGRW